MSNTSVRAAAEGMPSINRRCAMLTAGVGFAAAALAVSEPKAAPAGTALAEVIQAHKDAYQAFIAALDVEQAAETSFFENHPRDVILPLSIGGGATFCVRFDLHNYANDCRDTIKFMYAKHLGSLTALSNADPDLAAKATAVLKAKQAKDLRAVAKAHKDAQAARDAHGYGEAERIQDEANEAEAAALTALCTFRCSTADEYDMRGRYLLSVTGGRFAELDADNSAALLRSLLIGAGS